MLCGDAFSDEQKARNFAYYERLTVRDSSLSACTQAVLAFELGHLELAHAYLREAALIDLEDLEHNTRDGLHIASLAGTWIGSGRRRRRHARHRRADSRSRRGWGRGCSESPSACCSAAAGCGSRSHPRRARYRLLEGEQLEIAHHGEAFALRAGDARGGAGSRRRPSVRPRASRTDVSHAAVRRVTPVSAGREPSQQGV